MPLYYSSAKFIRVQHTWLSIFYYLVAVGLLAYVGIYQIWYKGGYQKTSDFAGAVDIKVKGTGFLGDVDTCEEHQWFVILLCLLSTMMIVKYHEWNRPTRIYFAVHCPNAGLHVDHTTCQTHLSRLNKKALYSWLQVSTPLQNKRVANATQGFHVHQTRTVARGALVWGLMHLI